MILIFITLWKNIQVDKNGCKYILFRIDVYFDKFLLAVEIDEKNILTEILYLRKKEPEKRTRTKTRTRQEELEKKLGCKFIRINTSNAKNGYDLDYEVGNVQAFIDEFKNKKIKKLEDKIKEKEEKSNKKIKELEAKLKELEDKNKNSTTNQITNNFGKIIIKNW